MGMQVSLRRFDQLMTARSEPVQALESDEFRQLHSAAGKGSADPEEVRGRACVGRPDEFRDYCAWSGRKPPAETLRGRARDPNGGALFVAGQEHDLTLSY